MISTLTSVVSHKEKKDMLEAIRSLAAKLTEDVWEIKVCLTDEEREALLKARPLIDLACCNISKSPALDWLKRLRKDYHDVRILLVANTTISPTQYVCPQVVASALLLEPYSKEQLYTVLEDFIRAYLEEADEGENFVITRKDEKVLVPYSQIYYMEAREKKVFIRLFRKEYVVYDTLGALLDVFPHYFVRTHRSFVVNGRMIQSIQSSEHMVLLRDGFRVPLSRSCSAELKERWQ